MSDHQDETSSRWTRTRLGRTVHADSDEHVRVVLRTLGIDEMVWAATLDHYAATVQPGDSLNDRLEALGDAFRKASPRLLVPDLATSVCPACAALAMKPCVARRSPSAPIVYGRCEACGHGQLVAGAAPPTIYESDAYFRNRGLDGTGYDAYEAERTYREAKGDGLLDWLEQFLEPPLREPSLLEVGSGFGFTRQAAAMRGFRTGGVDLNPFAARAARQLYGFDTVTGTLGAALDSGAIAKHSWNIVLYQFVLEHIPDPALELRRAAEAVAPGGYVVFVAPSMATFEIDLFGAAYRSLRADHFHLFSIASARAYVHGAKLTEVAHKTTCSLHLLKGFVEPGELDELYARDRGPDLFFMSRSAG